MDRFEQAQGAQCVNIGGMLGRFEADRDVGLRRDVVDLVGLDTTS